MSGEATPAIRWHTGPRSELRGLFALADDSAAAIERDLPLGRVLVAVEDGALVGHAQLVPGDAPGEIELRSLAVAEDRQGRGIGRALVGRAVQACRADGGATLVVSAAAADVGALRFYQRQGFRMLRIERDAFTVAAGYPEGLVSDGIPVRDRVWLSLALAAS